MYIVNTLDTAAVFVYDKGIILKSLSVNGKERALYHKIALPAKYIRVLWNWRATKEFNWEFYSFAKKENGFDILLTDKEASCRYLFKARGSNTKGPIEISGVLTNTGHNNVRIIPEELFSAELEFKNNVQTLHIMKESGLAENVRWHTNPDVIFPGSGIYKQPLIKSHTIWCTPYQEFNQCGMIPMLFLTEERKGAYLAVEWPSCRIHAKKTENGALLSYDLGDCFSTKLTPGQNMLIPPVYLGAYDGDLDDGSNIFKRWFFLNKAPKNLVNNEQEPYTQIDFPYTADLKEYGVQSVKWDYGWWATDADKTPTPKDDLDKFDIWTYYEGSWKLRNEGTKDRLKNLGVKTIAEYSELLKKKGVPNLTVYLLLHDSLKALSLGDELTSVGPNAHPEWFTGRLIGDRCPTADLGNEECVAYLKRRIFEFMTENNVQGWRSDFEPIPIDSDNANRHDANGTDVTYWCAAGFYEILDYLIENIPDFRYECCSQGGSMKDFATMRRTVVFNNDDSANFNSLRTTFYDSSYCFPPAQLQTPSNMHTCVPESPCFAKVGNKDFGFRSLIMAAVMCGFAWDEKKNIPTDGLGPYITEYLNLHNQKVKHLLRNADLYHILPRPDGVHWDGMQYGMKEIPENKICGASFIFKPTNKEGSTKHIPVRGLNPDITYSCEFYEHTEQSFIAKGSELLEKGFEITINEECGSEIVFFKAI